MRLLALIPLLAFVNLNGIAEVKRLHAVPCRMAAAVAEEQLKQTPHGGQLINLVLQKEQRDEAIQSCNTSLELSHRGACDVELLSNG